MVYVARKTISGKSYYYLVRSIKVDGQVHKLQRYLGANAPSPRELERLEQSHASWFEAKAVETKARVSSRSFDSAFFDIDTLESLEKARFDHRAARQLMNANEIIKARQHFKISHLQATLALAGTELTRLQLNAILLEETLPSHITLNQVKLLLNLDELFDTMVQARGPLDLSRIFRYHRILARGVFEDGGQLRGDDATLQGSSFVPVPAVLLSEEMEGLVFNSHKLKDGYHPFEAACVFHHQWGQLHPFSHGNGILGRELFNYQMEQAGYPPMVFPTERGRYIGSLQAADGQDTGSYLNRFACDYLDDHQRLLAAEGGLEKAVRVRQGQSRLDLFGTSVPSTLPASLTTGRP